MESVKNRLVTGIKLARNSGHQHALLAGIETVKEMDCSITLDADLQDDIEVIDQFIEKFLAGYDIVYDAAGIVRSIPFLKNLPRSAFTVYYTKWGSRSLKTTPIFAC